MLLRRITQHIKAQNWFAVGVDFIIVVIGVFIGIQVANWNETRQAIADEETFIQRLHNDVHLAEGKSERLRTRRFQQNRMVIEGMEILFDGSEQDLLSDDQCLFIAFSHDLVITAPAIPSFNELLSSGRLGIIRDQQLLSALAGFQQSLEVLDYWRSWGSRDMHLLSDKYPDLVQIESFYDEDRGEVWSRATCDTAGMRANRRLLSNLSENSDTLDGFVRDALEPWNEQFEQLHSRLHEILNIADEDTQ